VEERILNKAQIKHTIQKTVYAGGFKLQAGGTNELTMIFKPNELKSMLLEGQTLVCFLHLVCTTPRNDCPVGFSHAGAIDVSC